MYEHRRETLLSTAEFARRVLGHLLFAWGLIGFGILAGMAGFRLTEHYSWADAFLNTCMLLGGMGQVTPITTPAGKIFAALFALFAGIVFIVVAGLIVGPFAHRVLHALHVER